MKTLSQQTHPLRRAKLSLKRPVAGNVSRAHESSESTTTKAANKQRLKSPVRATTSPSTYGVGSAGPTISTATLPEENDLAAELLDQHVPRALSDSSKLNVLHNMPLTPANDSNFGVMSHAESELREIEGTRPETYVCSGDSEQTETCAAAMPPSSRLPVTATDSATVSKPPLDRKLQSKLLDGDKSAEELLHEASVLENQVDELHRLPSQQSPELNENILNGGPVDLTFDQSGSLGADAENIDDLPSASFDVSNLKPPSESQIQPGMHQSSTSLPNEYTLLSTSEVCGTEGCTFALPEHTDLASSRVPLTTEVQNGDNCDDEDDDFEGLPIIRHKGTRNRTTILDLQSSKHKSCKLAGFSKHGFERASRGRRGARGQQGEKRPASALLQGAYTDNGLSSSDSPRTERNFRLAMLETELKDIDRHLSKLRRRHETVQKEIDHIYADNKAEDVLPVSAPGPDPTEAVGQLFGSDIVSLHCAQESLSTLTTSEPLAQAEILKDSTIPARANSSHCGQGRKLWLSAANIDETWVDTTALSSDHKHDPSPAVPLAENNETVDLKSSDSHTVNNAENHFESDVLPIQILGVDEDNEVESKAPDRSCGALKLLPQQAVDKLSFDATFNDRFDLLDGPLRDLAIIWADKAPEGISIHFPNWRENLYYGFAQDSNEIDSAIYSMRERRHALLDEMEEVNKGNISAMTFFIEAFMAALEIKRDASPEPSEFKSVKIRLANESMDLIGLKDDVTPWPCLDADVGARYETIISDKASAEPRDDVDLGGNCEAAFNQRAVSACCEETNSDSEILDITQRDYGSYQAESQRDSSPTHADEEPPSVGGSIERQNSHANKERTDLADVTTTEPCLLAEAVEVDTCSDATLSDSETLDLTQRENDVGQSDSEDLGGDVASYNVVEYSHPSVHGAPDSHLPIPLGFPESDNLQQSSCCSGEAAEVICEFVQSRPELYERVLMFESLDPRVLQAELHASAHLQLSLQIISSVLRKQGISVSEVHQND